MRTLIQGQRLQRQSHYHHRPRHVLFPSILALIVTSTWVGACPDEKPIEDSAKEDAARRVFREFGATFRDEKGYMRPSNDAGWKLRFESLRALSLQGDSATAAILEALTAESIQTRILAAQALSQSSDLAAREGLIRALESDSDSAVRLYAADALGRRRFDESGVEIATIVAALRKAAADDKNGDVRSHAEFALEALDPDASLVLERELALVADTGIDVARLGELARDFTLEDATGRPTRLGDFRGKRSVLLIFIYGDT
jgi:hypothetical protein